MGWRTRKQKKPEPNPKRLWAFRIIALLLPIALLLVVEAGLRVAGLGFNPAFWIPAETEGQLRENPEFGNRFFPEQVARRPQPLLIDEETDRFRILLFGGSAAMGDPEPGFGLARYLKILLEDRYGTEVEVVNVAMTAINSHVVREIAADSANLDADLWLIYMGNNEVIGPYGASSVLGARAGIQARATRLGQLVSKAVAQEPATGEWTGLQQFMANPVAFDDPKLARVHANFRKNLEAILDIAPVPVVLSTVVTNLKDCAPFGSAHSKPIDQAAWDQHWAAGVATEEAAEFAKALESYRACLAIDDGYAELHFRMGRCLEGDEALAAFVAARDHDTLRFRCDSALNNHIRAMADRCTVVDAEAILLPRAGFELFYEHVHFHHAGNHALAQLLAEAIGEHLPATGKDWLDLAGCDRQLAFTLWHEQRILQDILRRQQGPPYALQIDNARTIAHWQARQDRINRQANPQTTNLLIANVRAALTRRPNDWILRRALADLQEVTGAYPQALSSWWRVTEVMPHEPNAWHHLGTLHEIQGDLDKAESSFNYALSLQPRMAESLNGLGLVRAAQNRQKEALTLYQRAIECRPSFVSPYINWARLLQRQNRLTEAIAKLEEAVRVAPDDLLGNHNLGIFLSEAQRFQEAISAFSKVLEINTDYHEARFRMAHLQQVTGKLDEAIANFAYLVAQEPNVPDVRVKLARALEQAGRIPDARDEYAEILAIDPANVPAREGLQRTRD